MKKLTFLGIASNSFTELTTCSFVLEFDDQNLLLIDCGPDIPRQIYKRGLKFYPVKTIVLTHSHLDHVLGLPYLLFGRNLEILAKKKAGEILQEADSELTIISERGLFDNLLEVFSFCHPEVKLQYTIKHIEIKEYTSQQLSLSKNKLQFFEVNHAVTTFGFKISSFDKSIAYSSDTLPTENFAEGCKDVDILIYECMMPSSETVVSQNTKHSTPKDVIEMVNKIKPKSGFLMHIQPLFFSQKDHFEKEIFEGTGIQLKYPSEGETIEF